MTLNEEMNLMAKSDNGGDIAKILYKQLRETVGQIFTKIDKINENTNSIDKRLTAIETKAENWATTSQIIELRTEIKNMKPSQKKIDWVSISKAAGVIVAIGGAIITWFKIS